MMDTWRDRSRVEPYTNFDGSGAPVGRVFSGRLNRSCESVEATPGPKESAYLAYPAECELVKRCVASRICWRAVRRELVILDAQIACDNPNAAAMRSTSAR